MQDLQQFSLTNKVIIISGATGVLGASFSLEVARAGAKVIVLGRNKERAQMRVSEIEAIVGEAMYILADVLSEAQIRQARVQVLDRFGTIDGLVNAAGGNIAGATIQPED